jgi:hypothetical protein
MSDLIYCVQPRFWGGTGTAFKSKWLNNALCYTLGTFYCLSINFEGSHSAPHKTVFFLGFMTFRGAKWYWYFHWAHHRFTNDPKLDPGAHRNIQQTKQKAKTTTSKKNKTRTITKPQHPKPKITPKTKAKVKNNHVTCTSAY